MLRGPQYRLTEPETYNLTFSDFVAPYWAEEPYEVPDPRQLTKIIFWLDGGEAQADNAFCVTEVLPI